MEQAVAEVIDITTGRRRLQFSVGELVRHLKFDYRGVIVRCDPEYSGTDEWYRSVARARPPKDEPWYEILVDGTSSVTYVSEMHLEADIQDEAIVHPLVDHYFSRIHAGRYFRI